ncbi:MAG: threonine transporter RhtB, partial [Alistipes sp.]|nr:threonine transporter RhtB [Alistipes sp.]
RRNRAGNTTLWKDFASMFGFTIANFVVVVPYILAFFALFGVGTATESRDVASMMTSALIILGFFCGACTWWTALTSVISLFRRRFRPRHMLTINHVAGIVVSLLGIYTILSTVISISNGAQ